MGAGTLGGSMSEAMAIGLAIMGRCMDRGCTAAGEAAWQWKPESDAFGGAACFAAHASCM